jgi:hypothetical protein
MKFPNELIRDPNGKVIAATDWLGNPLRVGDRVAYCISAGRGQQMAIGVLEELRPILIEDRNDVVVLGDSFAPKPTNTSYGYASNTPGKPRWASYFANGEWQQATWIVHNVYEYAETKIRRIAASGWDGKTEKAARFVNEMNVTSIEGFKEACYKI